MLLLPLQRVCHFELCDHLLLDARLQDGKSCVPLPTRRQQEAGQDTDRMSGFLGRMRGAVGQQQQAPQQQLQQQGYMNNGNGMMSNPHQQYSMQAQQQQHLQSAGGGQAGSRRTTPTTPQFSPTHSGPILGVHDCLQPNGGKPLYLCQPFVKAALVKGSFRTITAVPKYVDGMEWVAVNLYDFFHNINLFLGIISEHCTRENCPTMSAGPGMDYTWTSGPNKKQVKVPAPEYTDYVLTWAEKLIGDETMFPTKSGREFSPSFPKTAVHLYTQFLRIFAHLYHAHFRDILHLSLEAHLNSLFAHFLMFGLTFELLDPKECRAPREGWGFVVGDLMDAWRAMGILEGGHA